MKPDEIKLAYLLISSPKPNVYIGGSMITDGRGLPVEFRYTEPIQPSKIQQILYGDRLSAYIKRDVITETLIKNMENKFKCLLVEDENLLSYPFKGIQVIRIMETKSAPLGGAGKFQEISSTELLIQTSKEGNPLRISVQEPYKEEKDPSETGVADVSQEAVLPAFLDPLMEAGRHMEIHEPLKRIEKALEALCQEEGILSPTK